MRAHLVAALVLAGLVVAPATSAVGAPHASSTTLSVDLPSSLGNGGDPQAASATIDDSGGSDIPTARIDLDVSPDTGTAVLTPSDLTLQYYDEQSSSYQSVSLTSDGDGGLTGYVGPEGGVDVPAGSTLTIPLRVASTTSAPSGSATVTSDLDTMPGDTSSAVASSTSSVALSVPTLSASGFPSTLAGGGDAEEFTLTLTNSTGSSYSGVRRDITLTAADSGFGSSDVTLQYYDQTTGSFQTVPLSGTGTLSGSDGPADGSTLAAGVSTTTVFRIGAADVAPPTTVTADVALDEVDSTGTVTGTVVTTTAGTTRVTGVRPTISADTSSAHRETRFGWFRSPVTVTFSCSAGSAPLATTCPSPVTLRSDGRNQSVIGTVSAQNGQSATVTVRHLDIDATAPSVRLTGVREARRTGRAAPLGCRAHDSLSGVADCGISLRRRGHTVRYRLVAQDRAGNVTRERGRVRLDR